MPKQRPKHPQIKVRGIKVDADLAEIRIVLWHKGVRTTHSCQGDDDQPGYVRFADVQSAVKFAYLARLHLTAGFCEDELPDVLAHFSKLTGSKFADFVVGRVARGERPGDPHRPLHALPAHRPT
jgi:hypothetical protein